MAMQKALRIQASRDGYRRCGVAHSKAPTDHPMDRFSKKQVARLEADPMLMVQTVEVETKEPEGSGGKKT